MKTLFLSVILMAVTLALAAQSNCNIKKAYAFYTVTLPGTQMANEHVSPTPPKPNIGRFIYIEWCGINNPKIEFVLYNNKPLAVTLTKVEGSSIIPGGNIGNNISTKISIQKRNSLWKLDLQPTGADEMPAKDCKNITIKNKTCSFKLVKETRLTAMPRY